MDNNKKIYGKWLPWDEILAIPFLIFSRVRGKNIRTLLHEKILKAQKIAEVTEVTIKDRDEYLLEYESLDNFFAIHFRNIEKSRNHTFEGMIDYCLNQYKRESFRNLTASRIVILEENFLKGAEKTLKLYFLLDKKVHRKLVLKDILIGENTETKLKKFLTDKRFIDENQNLIVDNKSLFIRLHKLLQDEAYINTEYNANTIMDIMDREYNSIFDKGTFSRAIARSLSDSEKKMQEELLKALKIKD